MMNLKALITTLVIGSSSIALAGPTVRDHRTPAPTVTTTSAAAQLQFRGDIRLADGRMQRRPAPAPAYTRPLTWVSLADNAQVNGRALINVARTQRQFTKLSIRAEGNGRTSIDQVMIEFGNGKRQVVKLDAKLSVKKQPSLTIDLAGDSRKIQRIVLVGKSNGRNASVDVLAI
jgi:hypothetical protein